MHRISGPLTIAEAVSIVGGPFRCSPVGLVEKVPGDGIWRMIRHLSKCNSNGDSTNGWINLDKFPTTYFAASWVTQFVSSCPVGTQAALLDIAKAFRHSPIALTHQKYLCVYWNDSVYVQHVAIEGMFDCTLIP